MYKIRTVDVWDTLLRRDCHPEFVKLATARRLLLTHREALNPEYRDQWALYRARVDAENLLVEAARTADRDDEYEISDVMHCWLKTVSVALTDPVLACELVEYELQVEIDRSYPDPGIAVFLEAYPAERTAFLSDFYMNASMLRRLLKAKGLDGLVSDGIASCDIGLNKRSGRLFKYFHALHEVLPAEHVHVGDNRWSDIAAAERVGVTAIHYVPVIEHAERLERERLFASRDALFAHARGLCRTDAATVSTGTTERAEAFRLGIEASPLFIGFALWIAEQALTQRLDRVCFLTPEGQFLRRVYLTLFPQGHHCRNRLPDTLLLTGSEQKGLTRDFLIQSGLRAATRLGIVDIGRRATIQGDFALLLPQSHLHGMNLGLRAPINPTESNAGNVAYLPEEILCDPADELFDIFAVLEMICSPPGEGETGAQHDGATEVSWRDRAADANMAYERLSAHVQEGVLFAAERWRPILEACVVSAAELRDQALKVWNALHRFSHQGLAPTLLQAAQHDPFEFDDYFARASIPPLSTVVLSPFVRTRRRDLIEFMRRVQWSAAIEKTEGIGWLHRNALVLTFRVANRIRLLRIKGRFRRSQSHARL